MNEWNMKEYIHQASYKIVINKLQRIGIESIHIKWMNEIIKNYIRQTSCKIVVKGINIYHPLINGWNENVGVSFSTLECAWESDFKINCTEVAYNYMWVALYIWYCIQHKVFAVTTATCALTLKAI